MKNEKQNMGRRAFLKLAGSAFGISALSYYLGFTRRAAPAPVDTLPDYADQGSGFPVFRGPYLQKNARLAAFLFNADLERLTVLCDQALNVSESFPYKYVPITPTLMLVYADMHVSSLDERDVQVGLIPETEVSFWVLTVAMQRTDSGYIPHHLAWFLPHLLVDEGNAIATGREVFGFNKQAAQFQKPERIEKPEFTADVFGFKQFGPEVVAQKERLLELRASSSSDSNQTKSDWEAAKNKITDELLKTIRYDMGGGLIEFAARFINDHIPLVFLKQFRDAQDTHKACYQKIVEAALTVEKYDEGGIMPNPYMLTIFPLASHPFAQRMGLKPGEQKSTHGAWIKVDFVLGGGVEVG